MNKLLRQAFFSIAEQFAQPIVMLVATFLLIRNLGMEQFGHFTIALTLTAMSPLLGLGTSALIVREVAHRFQTTGLSTVCDALREALSVLLTMSALASIAMAIYFTFQPSFMGSHEAESSRLVLVVTAGLGCATAQEIDLLYSGTLKGLSRFGWSAIVEIGGRLVWLLVVVFGAQLWGLEGALLSSLAIMFSKAFVKGLLCAHLIAAPMVFLPSTDIRSISALLHRSAWLWVQGLGGILLFSVDRLIVGHLFGAAVMGSYVACAQVVAFGLMMPGAAGQVLVPWFLEHNAAKSAPLRGWRVSLWGIAIISAMPGLLIAATSYLSLSFWLGTSFAEANWTVLAVLAIGTAAVASVVPFHFCLLSVGATRPIALANLAGGLVSTLVCVALANYGLTAFSLGKLAYAIPLAALPYLLFRLLSNRTPVVAAVSS